MCTPWNVKSSYVIHACGVSTVIILWVLGNLIARTSVQVLFVGLLAISAVDMISYRCIIYKVADLFDRPFPRVYRHVRPNDYQPIRIDPKSSNYFRFKALDSYAIASSYLQEDFCPAPRQDLIAASVKALFEQRHAHRQVRFTPKTSLHPMDDHALKKVIGCEEPKIRLVDQVLYAQNERDAKALVVAHDIYQTPIIMTDKHLEAKVVPAAPYQVKVRQFTANRLKLDINNESSTPRWLVYADAFNEHWRVTVDNEEQPLFAANIAFKAVEIPAGYHHVQFMFSRPHVTIGFMLFGGMMSLMAFGLLVMMVWGGIEPDKMTYDRLNFNRSYEDEGLLTFLSEKRLNGIYTTKDFSLVFT